MSAEQPPPRTGNLAGDTARYFVIHALVVLGGIVSMPITTRLLSREQYGELSLVMSLLGLVTVVGTLGFANGTTRLFPEHREGGAVTLRSFCETMLTGSLATGMLTALAVVAFAGTVVGGDSSGSLPALLALAALVVLRVVTAVVLEVLRSTGAVDAVGVVRVGARWATLAAVAIAIWIDPRAVVVVAVTVAVEIVVLLAALRDLRRRDLVRRPRLLAAMAREATTYGAPLALAGGVAVVTVYGDRFLIDWFLGPEPVAQYSVPYDLTRELARALALPVQMALAPQMFQRWTQRREAEVSRSMSDLITMLLAVAIPVGALFAALAPSIVTLVASAKYEASGHLVPYLVAGVFLNEGAFLLGIGLRLARRTGLVALVAIGGAVLNMLLNVVLLPRLGLEGAALATTITYVLVTAALYRAAAPILKLQIRTSLILKSALVSAAACAAVRACGELSASPLVDVLVRGGAGALLCAGAVLALDGWARRTGRNLTSRLATTLQ